MTETIVAPTFPFDAYDLRFKCRVTVISEMGTNWIIDEIGCPEIRKDTLTDVFPLEFLEAEKAEREQTRIARLRRIIPQAEDIRDLHDTQACAIR